MNISYQRQRAYNKIVKMLILLGFRNNDSEDIAANFVNENSYYNISESEEERKRWNRIYRLLFPHNQQVKGGLKK